MQHDDMACTIDGHDERQQSGIGPGAIVLTADGELPVEWLSPGDLLITRDNGAQPLLAIVRQRAKGAEGAILPMPVVLFPGDCMTSVKPWEKLRLAPGHRVLLRNGLVQLHFGLEEALARPCDLTRRRAARADPSMGGADLSSPHLAPTRIDHGGRSLAGKHLPRHGRKAWEGRSTRCRTGALVGTGAHGPAGADAIRSRSAAQEPAAGAFIDGPVCRLNEGARSTFHKLRKPQHSGRKISRHCARIAGPEQEGPAQ